MCKTSPRLYCLLQGIVGFSACTPNTLDCSLAHRSVVDLSHVAAVRPCPRRRHMVAIYSAATRAVAQKVMCARRYLPRAATESGREQPSVLRAQALPYEQNCCAWQRANGRTRPPRILLQAFQAAVAAAVEGLLSRHVSHACLYFGERSTRRRHCYLRNDIAGR